MELDFDQLDDDAIAAIGKAFADYAAVPAVTDIGSASASADGASAAHKQNLRKQVTQLSSKAKFRKKEQPPEG